VKWTPGREAVQNPPVTCRGCILVVDDDPDIRDALTLGVESLGCTAVVAVDGADAFQRLEHCPPPCLVLLDLNMPRMDGQTFARVARDNPGCRRLKIVSMSASCHRLSPPEVEAHLAKPFDLGLLEPTIARFCADRSAANAPATRPPDTRQGGDHLV
jgi:CheY-like chemotaxis protein